MTAWKTQMRHALFSGLLALQAHAVAQTAPAASAASGAAACPPTAQAPTAEQAAAAIAKKNDRGFLWRITKDGRSSYLYGTIHVARMEWMFPGPRTLAALRDSNTLALEIDGTDPELAKRLALGMAPRAGEPGASLPEDLAERLRSNLRLACLPLGLMRSMTPELLGMLLTMGVARDQGFDSAYGIDMALGEIARHLRKRVVSLETPELQLEMMRAQDAAELREAMEKMLGELESGSSRPLLLRMANVWSTGSAAEMGRYREWCGCATTPHEQEALKKLLDDRNGPMAERIDALHGQGESVFAAVGSLHMFGPAALPQLMGKRGYRVEFVDFNASPPR